MNPTLEERLRTDLRAAAESIVGSAPGFELPRRTRPRHVVAISMAALIAVGGGVAVASRLVPDDVETVNEQMDETGVCGAVMTDQATMMASAVRPDGNEIELWVSPTSTGNIATTLRIVERDGAFMGSASGCGYDNYANWSVATTEVPDGQRQGTVDVYGRTDPDARTVRVTFDSGAVVTADVQTDGYFVKPLIDDVNLYEQVTLVEPLG